MQQFQATGGDLPGVVNRSAMGADAKCVHEGSMRGASQLKRKVWNLHEACRSPSTVNAFAFQRVTHTCLRLLRRTRPGTPACSAYLPKRNGNILFYSIPATR